MSSTLGGTYTAHYAYTNLGQLWQGPQNGTGTQEQYLYCDSSHPHQLSNLSQVSSSPTCASKGTIDYTGSYDAWGNTTSQQRGSTTTSTTYDAQDQLLHWSSTTNNQQEWYLYDASGERVLRRSFDGTNTTLTVYAFGLEEHQYAYSGSGSGINKSGNGTSSPIPSDALNDVAPTLERIADNEPYPLRNEGAVFGNRIWSHICRELT